MMRPVAYNEELAGRVRTALADSTDVEEKRMFGGLSLMVGGKCARCAQERPKREWRWRLVG